MCPHFRKPCMLIQVRALTVIPTLYSLPGSVLPPFVPDLSRVPPQYHDLQQVFNKEGLLTISTQSLQLLPMGLIWSFIFHEKKIRHYAPASTDTQLCISFYLCMFYCASYFSAMCIYFITHNINISH